VANMFKKLCLATVSCVLFFILLEGLCSCLMVAYELWPSHQHRTLSAHSVQYDSQLGWVSVPNFSEKNYYAPGVSLRINSQGFRSNQEFTQSVPEGKFRIICSGDSFTFGDGVDNDGTWCQRLESTDPRFQVVNMGETGYGADQMYLRYMREGSRLDHDVHVFAFIADDMRRMQLRDLGGYGKPFLKLHNGELATENVPVPRRSSLLRWLALKPNPLREFKSLALLSSVAEKLAPPPVSAFSNGPTEGQAQILDAMFKNLQAIEKEKNSLLILLYLPTRVADYEAGGASLAWRTWTRNECAKRGITFVDFIDDFQKLPVTMKDGLFIWPGSIQYFAEVPGHYDDQGHSWIARELYTRLISIPEVATKLDQRLGNQVAKDEVGSGVGIENGYAAAD
jgi:hypothetical protein